MSLDMLSLRHLLGIEIEILYSLARDAVTEYLRLGGLNKRNFLSHTRGARMPRIKEPAGLAQSNVREGRMCSRPFSLACRWPSSPYVTSSHLSACLSSHAFFLQDTI